MNLTHSVRVGLVMAPTNETGPIATLQLKTSSWELRDNIPHMQMYGFGSALLPTANVTVVNLAADNANGVVVASNDQKYRPQNMRGGESMVYDCNGQKVYLSSSNGVISINIVGNQQVNITANTSVNLTCPDTYLNTNLHVKGTIDSTGDMTAGEGGSAPVTLLTHVHTGVQGGTGSTGLPTG